MSEDDKGNTCCCETDRDSQAVEFQVHCCKGLQGLLELESQWRELEKRVPAWYFCHAFDWYRAALSAGVLEESATYFFTVRSGTRTCLLVPLQWRVRHFSGMRLRCWEIPQHPHLPLSAALMDSAQGAAALAYLLGWLRCAAPRDWDCLHFPRQPSETACRASLRPAGVVRERFRNKYLACATQQGDVVSRQLRRAFARLEQDGAVELVEARHDIALETAFVQFLQLERDGWKGRRGSAIAQHAELIGFYRRLIALGTEASPLRANATLLPVIYLLRQAGRPIAAVFAVQGASTCYLLKIAWARRARAGSPGKVLIELIRQQWCRGHPGRELNFVTGVTWVEGWSPDSRPVLSRRWFNTTLRGRLAWLLMKSRQVLADLVPRLRGRSAARVGTSTPKSGA